tara:strand:+ start:132 stop:722 length:591 start_codon:yes stop_codon:yes gene_type:complete
MTRATPTTTGAWWAATNASSSVNYYLDSRFAAAVVRLSAANNFSSLLDVGAGVGRYVRYYRSQGLSASGVDGLNDVFNRSMGAVDEVDLAKASWCRRADVVTCLEVMEHVPAAFEEHVVDQLACCAGRRLILSWAPPLQLGNGHVNLRNVSYVVKIMERRGWHERADETLALRQASALRWFRRNVLSFSRQDSAVP